MASYALKNPVPAVRYAFQVNEQEVAALVADVNGPGHSYSNNGGHLHIYNNGPELRIEDGTWVVALAGNLVLLNDADFEAWFTPC